ncbi:hypothetical protein NQ318_020861 [Aromia moschata]|uniref:DUF4817 domain-containing protein n=1 Tax=Aromia moschata TaxID=1265417 RepID=A0AAV8XJA7_9CUCU|nr:hypothetical protein NQ318_020861 [Aromia moschata]
MVYLTKMHKITILQMIGYGDRTRTQAEVVRLFQEKYPECTADISRYLCGAKWALQKSSSLQQTNTKELFREFLLWQNMGFAWGSWRFRSRHLHRFIWIVEAN